MFESSCVHSLVSTEILSPLARGTSIPALQNIRSSLIHRPIAKSDGHRFPELMILRHFPKHECAPQKRNGILGIYWFSPTQPTSDFLLSSPPSPSSLEPSAAPRKIRFELKSSGDKEIFSSSDVSSLSIRSVAARVPVPRRRQRRWASGGNWTRSFIGSPRATIIH